MQGPTNNREMAMIAGDGVCLLLQGHLQAIRRGGSYQGACPSCTWLHASVGCCCMSLSVLVTFKCELGIHSCLHTHA